MKLKQLAILVTTAALLAACKPSTDTDTQAAAESSVLPVAATELPVRYSVIDLTDIDTAPKLTARVNPKTS